MESNNLDLTRYGIDIGLLISGLFGAILLTSKGSAMNLGRTFSSLVGGAASANYLTPVIISITKLENIHIQYSVAFILGYLGLRSLDFLIDKMIKHFNIYEQNVHHTTSKRTTRSKKK